MRKVSIVFLLLSCIFSKAQNNISDSANFKKIANEILLHGQCYPNLRYLCKQIGPRLSGSANAQKAVEATAKMLRDAGADTVYLQPCMVPHWVRGQKEISTVSFGKTNRALHVCALGGSVGTPTFGLTANVVQVQNFEELDKIPAEKIKGKIVFFNYPMRPDLVYGGYGDAVRYRGGGAVAASKKGAIACMVRSVTHALDWNPHTGALHYADSVKKIPAFACSTMDAEWLDSLIKNTNNGNIKLYLKMNCETLPDAPSFNVVGQIKGSQFPNEIITVGGHLDSWDLAEGAHDDGSGAMQSIEVLRAIKASGLPIKRTIRTVMFMNEENGTRGANKYAELAIKNNDQIIFALESDEGGFGATSLGLDGKPEQVEKLRKYLPLFKPYGVLDIFGDGGGGTDIGPLKKIGTMMCSLNPGSQRYFDVHHSSIDVFENVNKRELEMGAVNMAGIIWLVTEYGL